MEELILQLKNIRFTEYEAKVFVSLVELGFASASDVHKHSKVPRARVYGILDQLVEKGVVLKVEREKATLYNAISVDLLIEQTAQNFERNLHDVNKQLKQLEQKTKEMVEPQVLSLQEKESIVQHCIHLLEKAKHTILISMWGDMYDVLRPYIEAANKRVHVKGLTIQANHTVDSIDHHRATTYTDKQVNPHWFIISIDHEECIYGSPISERSSAFLTDDPMHVYILEDYIWHDVLVNRLVNRMDEETDSWIKEQRSVFFNQKNR